MLTSDQHTALLMEIADLRIRVANLLGENEQLTGKLRVAEARLAEHEPGDSKGDQPAASPNGSAPQPVVA